MKRLLPFILSSFFVSSVVFAETVAFLPLKDPRIPVRSLETTGRALIAAAKKERSLTTVSKKGQDEAIKRNLREILKEEMDQARGHFYHFHFEEGERLLVGRSDPEALKLRALLASAQGDEKRARQELIRLLQVDPRAGLDSQDYPPRLISLFHEVKGKRVSASGSSSLLKLGEQIILSENFLEEWRNRFTRMGREVGWDAVLLYRIEPIGWNYKLIGTLFQIDRTEPKVRNGAIEIIDLKSLDHAAEVLVKSMFPVDTDLGLQ